MNDFLTYLHVYIVTYSYNCALTDPGTCMIAYLQICMYAYLHCWIHMYIDMEKNIDVERCGWGPERYRGADEKIMELLVSEEAHCAQDHTQNALLVPRGRLLERDA